MLDVILTALKVEDYELGNWSKNEHQVRYGKVAADCIVKAVTLKVEQVSKEVIKQLVQKDILDLEETANLILKIKEVRKKDRFSISDIMDMYHCGNDFLVRKSKEYIVINYGRYVHNIVHKVYPTYAEKYEEELYHSGLMGLIIAMKGYSVEKEHLLLTVKCSSVMKSTVRLIFTTMILLYITMGYRRRFQMRLLRFMMQDMNQALNASQLCLRLNRKL